ncbi:LLM class flavin-dependent oxidoreductase [Pseudonocardia bannensis]|uniref:LLM class flavin-dependent oxidoreductase n=1 Tax=Pseudonocardia bannensis TaxID=630973 RepID=A0A848DBN1_9PSEU|nr:LLM class flavin-dependent oxidoreductase [Pseudonocardia bannensis]NMH90207.1 LLM class flavin-dependent oxidoreductase [Pseudonocardia bannensis]
MEFFIGSCAKIDQVGIVKQAEDVGVTHFGAGEGPLLFSDPYQFLALAARDTTSINLGTWVTNPLTRIPAVTANSHATLNALAPGRVFMGIGTANNALRSMGHSPATIAELDDALRVSTALMAGERVTETWRGKERELQFLDPNGHWYNFADPIPVWMAAGGPRGIQVAARYADYVAYCLGPDPEMIKLVRRELDKAVADAGRAPGSVKLVAVSWFYQLRNGETWEDAVDSGFGSGPISSCLTNVGFMQAHASELDPQIVEATTQAAMAYLGDPNAADPPHYLETWAKYLRGLDPAHRSLITKELCDYWCLYGSPDEIWEKSQGMLEAGVDMMSVFLSNPFTAERDIADIGSSILARA